MVCNITALDDEGGFTNATRIYQGTADSFHPQLAQTHPVSLVPGAAPVEFTTTGTNTSPAALSDIQFDLYLSGDNTATTGIDASQVHLQYSLDDSDNFSDYPLDGTTTADGVIAGSVFISSTEGLAQGESHTIHFKVSLDKSAALTATTTRPLTIETDLDQVNPADGAVNNLEYAGPDDVAVAATPVDLPVVTATTPAAATPTVATAPGAALPFTGSTGTPLLAGAGLLAVLLGAGFLFLSAGMASRSKRTEMLVRVLSGGRYHR